MSSIKEEILPRSTGGSVVECSPATRAARVRFPASAFLFLFQQTIFMKTVTLLTKVYCFISFQILHSIEVIFK